MISSFISIRTLCWCALAWWYQLGHCTVFYYSLLWYFTSFQHFFILLLYYLVKLTAPLEQIKLSLEVIYWSRSIIAFKLLKTVETVATNRWSLLRAMCQPFSVCFKECRERDDRMVWERFEGGLMGGTMSAKLQP